MSGLRLVYLLAAAPIFLWLVYVLSRAWRSFGVFDQILRRTPNNPLPSSNPFDGESPVVRGARAFLDRFNVVATKNLASNFPVHLEIQSTADAIRAETLVPRALVGILILSALLITLFNLQGSVGQLGDAFGQFGKTDNQRIKPPEETDKEIAAAMTQIAQTAGNAFSNSAIVILLAVTGMALTVFVQRRGLSLIHRFSDWAAAGHYNALAASPAANERALLAEMAATVAQMNGFVTSIDGMTNAIRALTEFSDDMRKANETITEAIDRLPDRVNESVSNLSSQVVRGLAEALDHYTTYLTRLIDIYGDHGIFFKDVHDFMDEARKQTLQITAALESLRTLPLELQNLNDGLYDWRQINGALHTDIVQLDNRISRLPVAEMTKVLADLEGSGHSLRAVREELDSIIRDLADALPSFTKETAKTRKDIIEWHREMTVQSDRTAGGMANSLEQITRRIAGIRDLEVVVKSEQLKPILERLSSLDGHVADLKKNWLTNAFGRFTRRANNGDEPRTSV